MRACWTRYVEAKAAPEGRLATCISRRQAGDRFPRHRSSGFARQALIEVLGAAQPMAVRLTIDGQEIECRLEPEARTEMLGWLGAAVSMKGFLKVQSWSNELALIRTLFSVS